MMSCSTTQDVLIYIVTFTPESNVNTPKTKTAMTLQQCFRFENLNSPYDRWLRKIRGLDWSSDDYLKFLTASCLYTSVCFCRSQPESIKCCGNEGGM